MKTKPPCKVNGIDCPRRYIGCRAGCEDWHKWLAIHEEEREQRKRASFNEADDFMIRQGERVRQARHREYLKERKQCIF